MEIRKNGVSQIKASNSSRFIGTGQNHTTLRYFKVGLMPSAEPVNPIISRESIKKKAL